MKAYYAVYSHVVSGAGRNGAWFYMPFYSLIRVAVNDGLGKYPGGGQLTPEVDLARQVHPVVAVAAQPSEAGR